MSYIKCDPPITIDKDEYVDKFVVGRILYFGDSYVLVGDVNDLSGNCDDCGEGRPIVGYDDALITPFMGIIKHWSKNIREKK